MAGADGAQGLFPQRFRQRLTDPPPVIRLKANHRFGVFRLDDAFPFAMFR